MKNDAIQQIFGAAVMSDASKDNSDCPDGASDVADNGVDDGARSQDLFNSPASSSHRSILNEQLDLTLDLTEFVWVQCDMADCQKWRRTPAANTETIQDQAWYCSMNEDPNANTCDAPEEDYTCYDRMAKRAGIKFVMSLLGVGSLVWAKIDGYCRWPAIVTRDPMTGVHVHLDMDGDPHSYHVEYLGHPHSHSWVNAKSVDIYGHKDECNSREQAQSSSAPCSKIGKRKVRRPKRLSDSQPKPGQGTGRCCYRNTHIEEVCREADHLLGMEADDRLRQCVFQYDPTFTDMQESHRETGEVPAKRRKQEKPRRFSLSNMTMNINSLTNTKYTEMKPDSAKPTTVTSVKTSQSEAKTHRELTNKEKMVLVDSGLDTEEEGQANMPTTAPAVSDTYSTGLDSPNQFSQSKLNVSSSMVGRTKEEKFKIDIDMYRKNEKAFEHDVRRFMRRNNQTIRSAPVWHNVPISLFQLFLAVHERGGYKKVCEGKQWTKIYKELTEMPHITAPSAAKKYYERNLYPYALHIRGESYLHLITQKPPHLPKASKVPARAAVTNSLDVRDNTTYDETYMDDLQAILGELDDADYNDDNLCLDDDKENALSLSFNISETETPIPGHWKTAYVLLATNDIPEDLQPGQFVFADQQVQTTVAARKENTSGISIKFHDESTDNTQSRVASCVSEFEVPVVLPDKPSVDTVKDYSGDEEMNLDDVETKVLHEMKALEEQMRDLNEELDHLL